MLEQAAECGTTDIVATPHCDLEYTFEPEVIQERADELRGILGDRIRLHTGCDFHLTFDNVQDAVAHPAKYTIAQKSYLLVEFSDLLIFKNCSEIFGHLLDAGIRPIITHPERNRLLQQRLDKLRQWVIEGCYLQITSSSIIGRFGKTAQGFCEQLIKENLVHFVASDCHDTKHRPPSSLKESYAWIAKHYSEDYAQRLYFENPKSVVAGEALKAYEPGGLLYARKWYEFWR